MFISALELFKIGIGPSSSHTLGPLKAANDFVQRAHSYLQQHTPKQPYITCTLTGSLAWTGKGHATDNAITLGLHQYQPLDLSELDITQLLTTLPEHTLRHSTISFNKEKHIIFDYETRFSQSANTMIFKLYSHNKIVLSETYFSIGGGFIQTLSNTQQQHKTTAVTYPFAFATAKEMIAMSAQHQMSIAQMKLQNELVHRQQNELEQGLQTIYQAMMSCVERGLQAEGILPGGLGISRRAQNLYQKIQTGDFTDNEYLCAYAMAVNEENAAGNSIVTAPTNGAAGVIPATLYYLTHHKNIIQQQIYDYLLTAASIGGLIKYNSSISGAEVGCQGEVGSAAAMAAAGMCAVLGGSTEQIENAAEIALEHHLGMTCDPVAGLVQVPCIERNGLGAIKAMSAASLALLGDGTHFVSLDSCIDAMYQTGKAMSDKFKETSQGGLAVSTIDC